jgi:hypothetical protein
MEVTLGCLIASMTLGAAVLDWSQPDRTLASYSSTELMARHVENAIGPSDSTQPGEYDWQSIRLSSVSPATASGRHVVIDAQGKYRFQPSFQQHQTLSGQPGVIQIGVVVDRSSKTLNPTQRRIALSLVQALQKKCGIPDARVLRDKQLILK